MKETGNDFQDVKAFEEQLNIEIQVYNLELRQIYRGNENQIKVYILMCEAHYHVISNIAAFTCANEDHHKAEYKKCKACKCETKCDATESQVKCTRCHKYLSGKTCFDNHIENNKCIDYSYICSQCHRYYKTEDLPMDEHKCDEIKCGNCKKYVNKDHRCYMLKKDIKPLSEKNVFFDFETKLDPKTKKHTVNYCIAQYFNSDERKFSNIDEFCKWVFNKAKHTGYTFIAHYGKGYDFQFIAEWLIAHSVKPNIIHNGL